MHIPAHFDDFKFHLFEFTEKLRLHEEWLKSFEPGIPKEQYRSAVAHILELAERQEQVARETRLMIHKLFLQTPPGVDGDAWKQLINLLDMQAALARDLVDPARYLANLR